MPRLPVAVFMILPACLLLAPGQSAEPTRAAEPAPSKPLAGVERDVRVQQYLESAQRKREAGDFEQALSDLRAANALVKKTRGDGHPDQLPLLDLAAEILVENDKMQDAEGPLQKAVALRESLAREGQSSQEVPLAASLLLLGKVHAALGKYESVVDMLKKAVRMLDTSLGPEHEKTFQARRELARSVEIFEETLGPEHPATLKALEELDEVQAALGDWTGAAANARKIIGVKQAQLGAANPETLDAVMTLTDLIAHGGAADEAITIQAEAIAAAEAAEVSPAVLVPSLRHLAALHLANEDYSPAIDAYTRARDLAAAHLGADGAEPLIDRLHLVDVAQKRGDDDPWDAGFEGIVARLRELAGQDDPRAAEGLRLAADALLAADSFDRASELYREALALDERLLGPAHVDVASDQTGLGRCLVGNGDTKAAESLLRTALQTMQREHGPAHAATLEVLARLAECAVRAGDAKTAEQCVAQILERRVPRQGAHAEEDFCRLVDAAAALCEKAGDAAKGGAIRDQLVAIRRAQFGESHEHVADVLVTMANARQAVRDYPAATAMYEAGIAIYEAALGAEHPDIAGALLPLSRTYRAIGKNPEAELALRRALGIWEATVGPEHEVTLATMKPLAIVLLALGREAEAIPLMERLLAGLDADPSADRMEMVKLLTKLAEVREAIGEADAARRDLRRAIEIEMRLADTDQAGSATDLADIAKLQQLLGDDEAAAENLARARDMAAKLPDAKDQIAKIEATAKPARKPVAAAPATDKPAPPPTVSSAAVIAAAKSKYRLGKRSEARGMLEKALGDLRAGTDRDLDRADLLVTLADMRQRTTDYDAAAVLYEEAQKIAIERGGSSSPRALVIALRLLGIRQAQGQAPVATSLVDDVEKSAQQVFAGGPSAESMDEVREAVRRAEAVSLAAGDRKSARRLLEIGLALAGRPDRRSALAALDTLAVLLASGRSSSAVALRTRLLDAEMLNARRDDPLSARFILHRGIAAEQAGDLPTAERDYRQALALDEATQGRDHPFVAVDLLRLAAVRELAGDRAGATEARGRAVAIAEQAGRAATSDVAADLRTLAVALGTAGETDAATKLIKAAVDAQLKSDGAKSIDVARLLADSADIFKRRGNAARASELLTEAMAIADAVVGSGHHETLALAAKLEQLKRFGATDQIATRTSVPLAAADAARPAAAGPAATQAASAMPPSPAVAVAPVSAAAPRDPEIDAALAAIAADVAAGRLPAALQQFKDLGQQVWKTHGVDDPRVAQVAVPYVHFLVEHGELRKARAIVDRAVAARTKSPGPTHPDTAETVLAAVAVDVAAGKIDEAWANYGLARATLMAAGANVDRAAIVQSFVARACELGDVATAIDAAERFLDGRSSAVAAAEATAVRATLCEALLAAGIADRAVAVARECVPQRAADATVDAESVPALARLAHVEQAAGLSEWTRTAAAAEAALAPALDAASPEQCAPGLIRAGRELARTHARAGDLAGGLSLAEHTAAAAARGLPERHTERLLAERVLAELLLESGSADRAAALLETARGQSIDFDVREAVLRHFATAATLPL
jgi:tetratricopeptide (TPR) repeat protein